MLNNKLRILLFCMIYALCGSAAEYITIENKDGEKTSFALNGSPKVTFTAEAIVLSVDDKEVQYPLTDYLKFYYTEDDETAIRTIGSTYDFETDGVTAKTSPGTKAFIYNVDGTLIAETSADSEGKVTLPATGRGIYVIRIGNKTLKYIKK